MKTSALYFHIAEEKLRTGRTKRRKTMFQVEFKAALKKTMLASYLQKFSRKKLPHAMTIVYYKATEYI